MQTLKLSTDSFDSINTFPVADGSRVMQRCSLHRDYKVAGDGVLWVMQGAGVLKSHYTAEDIAERDRLNAAEPIRSGDVVEVEGKQYRVRVLGNFSDCAILDPI